MKTRKAALMCLLDILLGITLGLYISSTGPVPAADNAALYADGSYTASAQGYLSEVTVTAVVAGGRLTTVEVDASGETPALGGQAAAALAPRLAEAGGTAGVDAVSGSTLTSQAVFAALDACLAQAVID